MEGRQLNETLHPERGRTHDRERNNQTAQGQRIEYLQCEQTQLPVKYDLGCRFQTPKYNINTDLSLSTLTACRSD